MFDVVITDSCHKHKDKLLGALNNFRSGKWVSKDSKALV